MGLKKLIRVAVALLVLYLAGYAACRKAHVLVHTAHILNLDFEGRYHQVDVEHPESLLGRCAGHVFWPLREIESTWHERSGRLD
jgi:hypothetical protein